MASTSLTNDQEVRVIALEFAAKLTDYSSTGYTDADQLVTAATKIETFIRG